MHRAKRIAKRLLTPVTIMLVPHSRAKPVTVAVPMAGVVASAFLAVVGGVCLLVLSSRAVEYYRMRDELARVSHRLRDIDATVNSLKAAEEQFRRLFSLKSKKEVIESYRPEDAGSLDMEALRRQIDESVESVADIRDYIARQKDIYLATPSGRPACGPVSSGYGFREPPTAGARAFHTGIDISAAPGTPVKATADGIVCYSGWSGGSGNTVVVEHGHGYRTAYAHNTRNLVRVGTRVRRGDTLGLSGSTGVSTGPHIHYEIWRNGKHVDPNSNLGRY